MSNQATMTRRIDHEVYVRGAHWTDLSAAHHLADTAIHWDRIRHRQYRLHHEPAIVSRLEDTTHPRLIAATLRIVKPVAIGLPDIERGACDRRAVKTADRADDIAELA